MAPQGSHYLLAFFFKYTLYLYYIFRGEYASCGSGIGIPFVSYSIINFTVSIACEYLVYQILRIFFYVEYASCGSCLGHSCILY